MIKIVRLVRCKCDECETTVDLHDKFCSECGNDLREQVKYEELKESLTR
jgi:hypothetical protein